MVECECKYQSRQCKHRYVLIDTWWNVNKMNAVRNWFFLAVLIDTWWNVNFRNLVKTHSQPCFNRYMVECEYADGYQNKSGSSRFNRYMVECE